MYGFKGHELVTLPKELKDKILPCLEQAGISIFPTDRKMSRRIRNAGQVLLCCEGNAKTDILVIAEDFLTVEAANIVAIIIFSNRGFFSELKYGSKNKQLREKIRTILYELKNEQLQ